MFDIMARAHQVGSNAAYVGFFELCVAAVRYEVDLHIWFGPACQSVLGLFAPTLQPHAVRSWRRAHLIACRFAWDSLVPVFDAVPLAVNHFVAAFPTEVPGLPAPSRERPWAWSVVAALPDAFALWYASLGLRVLPTVADGNCGLDALACLLGLE